MTRAAAILARETPCKRLRLEVTGRVQGVGFRPFAHRLASDEGVGGFVRNTEGGVTIEIEGPAHALDRFLARLDEELPPPAFIEARKMSSMETEGNGAFVIAPSMAEGSPSAQVLPDLAPCPKCLAEIFDPSDRRYLYPFTTCVQCGPRYSLIEAIPYDRARTTMRHFTMCADCQREYDDPRARRFHAETNACPACGPTLALRDAHRVVATRHQALKEAADALRAGRIVALKGLGGFQLLADARNEAAIERLRAGKRRPAKPFAILVERLADARRIAQVEPEEEAPLGAPEAPIVLLRARCDAGLIATNVAPDNPRLGVMLPATPLHHLLMRELGFPIVATSGNLGEEPIIADTETALEKLGGIADLFLTHDRAIVRPVDDSVVRVMAGCATVLRLARGYAPLSLKNPLGTGSAVALGGHQKSAIAVVREGHVVLGPHIADLHTPDARAAFAQHYESAVALSGVRAEAIACDRHPDYYTTRFAQSLNAAVEAVPHHLAHVLSGMLDNALDGPVLGVAWDGAGFGSDGTIWGGEFLAVGADTYRRVARLMPFRLPGGAAAMREPRRAALGALYEIHDTALFDRADLRVRLGFSKTEWDVLAQMLARDTHAPLTSSAGRLFDAAAAIFGLKQKASFEGEAAMAVEFKATSADMAVPLPPPVLVDEGALLTLDWRPTLSAMAEACLAGEAAGPLAAGFHDALVQGMIAVARRMGIAQVLLTGGCFQNAYLTECAVARLAAEGFAPYWHHRVPPNDGGLAAGQALFATHPLIEELA